ncbi:hypothetical protein CANARDRAFT_22562 [[Candida] arabinofermentans NRRL YB-2248]|uniref:Uncharacterized protein n=1 Tax=[Candida] arabinofermentans NRRL YB-2248 TaxID=983967 RepID=A0A1E4T1Y0_9ASCO|nr:hypothetical protein CANARDRAFT_22562 [[Candida] arabinofermentans NRRL YB-2248]
MDFVSFCRSEGISMSTLEPFTYKKEQAITIIDFTRYQNTGKINRADSITEERGTIKSQGSKYFDSRVLAKLEKLLEKSKFNVVYDLLESSSSGVWEPNTDEIKLHSGNNHSRDHFKQQEKKVSENFQHPKKSQVDSAPMRNYPSSPLFCSSISEAPPLSPLIDNSSQTLDVLLNSDSSVLFTQTSFVGLQSEVESYETSTQVLK